MGMVVGCRGGRRRYSPRVYPGGLLWRSGSPPPGWCHWRKGHVRPRFRDRLRPAASWRTSWRPHIFVGPVPGDPLGPGRGVLLDVVLQKVVAKAPPGDKILVDETFVHHHVEHGKGKGRIRSRSYGYPDMGHSHVGLNGRLDGDNGRPLSLAATRALAPSMAGAEYTGCLPQ